MQMGCFFESEEDGGGKMYIINFRKSKIAISVFKEYYLYVADISVLYV